MEKDALNLDIFLAVFGAAAAYCAVRSTLAILFPKHRAYWGGPFTGRSSKYDPNRMPVGVVASTGSSILWTAFALASFWSLFTGSTQRTSNIGVVPGVFLACIIIAFILIFVGWRLDSRAHNAARHEGQAEKEKNR